MVDSNPDAQLLLQADELIYDNDNNTITARGDVRVDYAGNRLVADKIVYRQQTARLIAVGSVEIVNPDGTRTFADEIDITDDFREGFVNSLQVVTVDKTRIGAESAIRENGNITTFNNGVYTACNSCPGKEGRPPLWQIKAQKVVWNGEEKTIRFEKAKFEFLGVPIAYLPVFTTADPSVKRKTGFLAPNFLYSAETGFGLKVPYFVNLAPNQNLTLSTTAYTNQGFLGEVDYAHRFQNGTIGLKIAGIHQFNPSAFKATYADSVVQNRGMIGTTGKFELNPRWTFGWQAMLQSDQNFAKTYQLDGYSATNYENNLYLTGLGTRSYFDARTIYYDVQKPTIGNTFEQEQGIVVPSVDYNYVVDRAVAGGELSFDVNSRGIVRRAEDDGYFTDKSFTTAGADADSWRLTTQSEWKRTFITSGGLMITPSLFAKASANGLNDRTAGASLSQSMINDGTSLNGSNSSFSGIVTAGLEVRYPILFTGAGSSHVVEPIAQLFSSPNEMLAGGLPNEDAQSLVFSSSTLFDRDRFSGYDRSEGGTRANLGVRYTGTFDNGWGLSGVMGQSIHLAGVNSFAIADNANAGADSGLETKRSDYVAGAGITSGSGFGLNIGARLDESTFDVKRLDASSTFKNTRFASKVGYAYIQAQPTYGFTADRHEIVAGASVNLDDNWSVFGSANYDIQNTRLNDYEVGVGYYCDCFTARASYSEAKSTTDAITRKYQFYISLRTLGDFGQNPDQFALR